MVRGTFTLRYEGKVSEKVVLKERRFLIREVLHQGFHCTSRCISFTTGDSSLIDDVRSLTCSYEISGKAGLSGRCDVEEEWCPLSLGVRGSSAQLLEK